MAIPSDLVQAIVNDHAVLFVGAGLSMGAGLPNWTELLAPLAQKAEVPVDQRNLLEVAQLCEIRLGRNVLLDHVCRATDAIGKAPTENHLRLLELGINTWVTTNYDDLLEATLRQDHQAYVKVVRNQDLPTTRGDAVTLIKLHGDREQRDTIVLTERDYETISFGNELVLNELKAQFAKKTFLFVGYGLNDPDLKQIHREISFVLGEFQPRAYAVVFEDDPTAQDLLRSRKIEPLYIETKGPDQYDQRLDEWLDELIEFVWIEREQQDLGPPKNVQRAFDRHRRKTTPSPPPTLRALDLYQLDAPPRDFTGREQELRELEHRMDESPLVLLWGIGGSGKRTLALVLADRLKERYPDAQLHCDLSGTSSTPRTAVDAMSEVIHAYHPEEPLPEDEDRLARRYRATLHGKRVLLLMNDAADEELVIRLRPPPSCAMIVTSRRDLAVDDFVSLKVAELTESDAVSYLQRIAPRVGDDAQQVARLCGSLPLALRLAGNALAHQRNLGVGRLIEQLRSRQQGQRFEPVYASLSVSYDELEPELQARWRDLAVFPGTFDKAAAAAVWAMPLAEENDPEDEVEDILGDLMRYAMVDWDDETERYRLQTLARGYATDLLDERTRSIVERRHARHYLQVLREANELYKQGGDCIVQGLEWFAQERINIEAGQAWTARHAAGEARSLCIEYPLAGANLLSLRLGPEDRKAWFGAAIRALPRLGDRTAEADLEGNLGNAQRERGELDEAIGHYEKALRIARRYHNRKSESYWQGRLSHAYIVKARSVEGAKARDWLLQAIEHCSQALKIDQEAPNRRMEGIHLGDLGNAYLRLREPWQAIGHYELALIIARDEGDRRGESTVLGHLGRAYDELDMVDQASNHYRQALSIDREIGDRWSEARHSWGLGEVHESMGDLQRAVDLMSVRAVYEREIGHQQAEEHAQRVEEIRQRI